MTVFIMVMLVLVIVPLVFVPMAVTRKVHAARHVRTPKKQLRQKQTRGSGTRP